MKALQWMELGTWMPSMATVVLASLALTVASTAQPGRPPEPPKASLELWIRAIESDPEMRGDAVRLPEDCEESSRPNLATLELSADQARSVLWTNSATVLPKLLVQSVLTIFESDDALSPGSVEARVWSRVRNQFQVLAQAYVRRSLSREQTRQDPTPEVPDDRPAPRSESRTIETMTIDLKSSNDSVAWQIEGETFDSLGAVALLARYAVRACQAEKKLLAVELVADPSVGVTALNQTLNRLTALGIARVRIRAPESMQTSGGR
ncbi:MAG: hypothetical protein AAF196_15030 [Planctomycetota bacterium]